MRRTPRVLLAAACALLLAPTAHAAGINLSWSDCGTFGQDVESFACNTNSGFHTLFASFVSPAPLTLSELESQIDIQIDDTTLPPWWNLTAGTGCRTNNLAGSADFLAGPFNCVDLWEGQASGGIDYTAGFVAPNRARIRIVFAVPPPNYIPIDDASQYYAYKVVIRNGKTTGTGSCAGCGTPGCIVLDYIRLDQPPGVGDYVLEQPLERSNVGWQCPSYPATEGLLCFTSCPVPAHKPSWGGIKSMYR